MLLVTACEEEPHATEGDYEVIVSALEDGTCPTCEAGTECAERAANAGEADGICDPSILEVTSGPELRDDGTCVYEVHVVEGEDC